MVHLIQTAILLPITNYMENAGQRIVPQLKAADLDRFDTSNPDHHIPLQLFMRFLANLEKIESFRHFLDHYSNSFTMDLVSQSIKYVLDGPNLKSCLIRAIKCNSNILSNETLSISISGTVVTVSSSMQDGDSPTICYVTALSIGLLVNGMQTYLGHDWQPATIFVRPDCLKLINGLFGSQTHIQATKTSGYSLNFPVSSLFSPSLAHHDDNVDIVESGSLQTLEERIFCIFDENVRSLLPSLEEMSGFTDMSPRTICRRLSQEGLSYRGIIDRWRQREVIRLMELSGSTIKEISENTGYTKVTNFHRAFRRWFGSTPEQYSEQISY